MKALVISSMSHRGRAAFMAAALLLAAGCAERKPVQIDTARLGAAADVVTASITAMGGRDRWRQGSPISAQAVVTVTDPSGAAMILFQRQEIDVFAGRLSAQVDAGNGRWSATVDAAGDVVWPGRIPGTPGYQHVMAESLGLLLRRVQGPFMLLSGPVECTSVEPVRVEGRPLVRVNLEGSPTGETAYYFDPLTHLLVYVTAAPRPGGKQAAVTTYEYSTLPGGVVFPTRIRVVQAGTYSLVGQQVTLDVQYQNAQFR